MPGPPERRRQGQAAAKPPGPDRLPPPGARSWRGQADSRPKALRHGGTRHLRAWAQGWTGVQAAWGRLTSRREGPDRLPELRRNRRRMPPAPRHAGIRPAGPGPLGSAGPASLAWPLQPSRTAGPAQGCLLAPGLARRRRARLPGIPGSPQKAIPMATELPVGLGLPLAALRQSWAAPRQRLLAPGARLGPRVAERATLELPDGQAPADDLKLDFELGPGQPWATAGLHRP